jgi:hypothetical protein
LLTLYFLPQVPQIAFRETHSGSTGRKNSENQVITR